MKQTAIEELENSLEMYFADMQAEEPPQEIKKAIERAKAKHKEELKEDIIKAFIAGVQSEYDELNKTLNKLEDFKIDYVKERGKAEQYYKENHEPK